MKGQIASEVRAKTEAFTIIELFVVIAVVALLVAVLLPAMAKSAPKSALVVCLNNQRQFATAWVMFNDDHSGYIVSASQKNNTSDSFFSWRIEPYYLSGIAPTSPTNGEPSQIFYDAYGFQKGGLYPYIKNSKVIYCPGDTGYITTPPLSPYCSYSMVDNMNGEIAPTSGTDYRIHKVSQIKNPSGRMVIDEENDAFRGFTAPDGSIVSENEGTWEPYRPGNDNSGDAPNPKSNPPFTTMVGGGTAGWYDGPAAFHINGATFSFCDGHAEFHRWLDTSTIGFANSTSDTKYTGQYSGGASVGAPNTNDVHWVYSHIATMVWQ